MRHLLLLALLGWAVAAYADGDIYAVIVSGGRSKMYNHERYWNDCSFLYRTLRQEYNIAKDHIVLLMANGDNPATDMLREGATGFASSPTDLDGDGVPDLRLSATRKNLGDTFRWLSTTLNASDHLFVFITDHGERSLSAIDGDQEGAVHLWLWGDEQVTPEELAAMFNLCRPATMNILLGQCHAGAFVAPLQGEGRIITAACASDQMSWSCKDRPYDEFVYHWTCAIAGHDEQLQTVDADQDCDGQISMLEAYDYAVMHDRRPEIPVFTAQPVGLAVEWSFSGILHTSTNILHPKGKNQNPSTLYDLQGRKYNP